MVEMLGPVRSLVLEVVVDPESAAARILRGEEDEGLLVGTRREDLRQFHQHGGAAGIGQGIDLDDGRRVARRGDEDRLLCRSPAGPARRSAASPPGRRGGPGTSPRTGVPKAESFSSIQVVTPAAPSEPRLRSGSRLSHLVGKRKARLESKKVGPMLTSTLEAGEEMERKTTPLARTTRATQTAYAIFLSCRTRSTRRRRMVRGMQDSRSLEED